MLIIFCHGNTEATEAFIRLAFSAERLEVRLHLLIIFCHGNTEAKEAFIRLAFSDERLETIDQ